MSQRKHHVHPRTHGNHSARLRRRPYPLPGSLTTVREGVEYGVRGMLQRKPAEEKGKK